MCIRYFLFCAFCVSCKIKLAWMRVCNLANPNPKPHLTLPRISFVPFYRIVYIKLCLVLGNLGALLFLVTSSSIRILQLCYPRSYMYYLRLLESAFCNQLLKLNRISMFYMLSRLFCEFVNSYVIRIDQYMCWFVSPRYYLWTLEIFKSSSCLVVH